jgi:hypothetical protein
MCCFFTFLGETLFLWMKMSLYVRRNADYG